MMNQAVKAYREFLERYRILPFQFWFIVVCSIGVIVILIFIPWSR